MAIEVIVVGLGSRGQDWVREVRAAPAFELGACVEVDQAVLQNVSASLSIPSRQCFVDLETAIDQTACRAVIIATPPDCHVEACETALRRRLAVMVEKPFTLRLDEAVRLVSLAERERVPLLVAQNYRYLRSFATVKRLIDAGALGQVSIVVCQYYCPPHHMAASLARLPHSILWGMGVHHLDAIRYALGKEFVNVTADSYSQPGAQPPHGATLRAMLSLTGGTRALYSATYESSGHEFFERGQEFYARFVGDRGTLHVFHRWLIMCERGKLPRPIRRGPRKMTEEQVLLKQLEGALTNAAPAEVSGRDNLKTMAVLEACVRSAADHTWVNPQVLLNESAHVQACVSDRA